MWASSGHTPGQEQGQPRGGDELIWDTWEAKAWPGVTYRLGLEEEETVSPSWRPWESAPRCPASDPLRGQEGEAPVTLEAKEGPRGPEEGTWR